MELMITGNMNVMKKINFIVAATALACTGCYDDYVKDFEHTGIYMPYQYDLRTFVVGEGMRFDVGVVLGGTSANGRDRSVRYVVEPALVTGNLAPFLGSDDEELEPVTAFEVMSGASASGSVSQSYVTDAMKASGISDLTPLPAEYFSLSAPERMVVRSGRHTATVTVRCTRLDEALLRFGVPCRRGRCRCRAGREEFRRDCRALRKYAVWELLAWRCDDGKERCDG